MNTIIRLENISAGYDGRNAVENVSLDIASHDYIGIIGPNGCGKTTLVKVILGLIKPYAGNVHYYRAGLPVDSITMGYLPQYNSIDRNFPISVGEVILSGLNSGKHPWKRYTQEERSRVEETVRLAGLEGLESRHIGALSGGQLQRALLARAIVSKPEAVVLDEPNTYVDSKFQTHLYDILATLNRDCAIILVSHDVENVSNKVKRIFRIT